MGSYRIPQIALKREFTCVYVVVHVVMNDKTYQFSYNQACISRIPKLPLYFILLYLNYGHGVLSPKNEINSLVFIAQFGETSDNFT